MFRPYQTSGSTQTNQNLQIFDIFFGIHLTSVGVLQGPWSQNMDENSHTKLVGKMCHFNPFQ